MAKKPIRVDPDAQSRTDNQRAFIAPQEGAPTYHGFAILDDTSFEGWRLGIISEPNDPNGRDWLDGFVIAPDGSRAGLVWDVNAKEFSRILEADEKRWGVFSVPLTKHVYSEADIISEFRMILPKLIKEKN